jgi:hypothetical protein
MGINMRDFQARPFWACAATLVAVVCLTAPSWAQSGAAKRDDTAAAKTGSSATTPDVPTSIRLRRLEQRVQALKERAWRAKARIGMLKEAVLGGGVGARASIAHHNKMGNSYRLLSLKYALDGAQIFARDDPSGKLHKQKTFDVLSGPIAPGSHTISVVATYRGNGYGPLRYINKYKFTVRSSHTFTAVEGKGTRVRVNAFEKGGVSVPLEKRPSIEFKVDVLDANGKAVPRAKTKAKTRARAKAKAW